MFVWILVAIIFGAWGIKTIMVSEANSDLTIIKLADGSEVGRTWNALYQSGEIYSITLGTVKYKITSVRPPEKEKGKPNTSIMYVEPIPEKGDT